MLRISNDRHYHQDDGYEQMFVLDTLEPAPDWPTVKLWGMGIASDDVTGDGLPDVMLSSMGDQLLQMNTGSGFEDAPYETGTFATRPHVGDDKKPSTGWHTEFGDVDNDGLLDLFIAKGNVEAMEMAAARDPNNLLMQKADGTFIEVSEIAGVASMEKSRGGGFADFNLDGRLDLVVVNRSAQMEIFRNATPMEDNWITVKARRDSGNRFAVGGWIEVETGAGVQAREITIGGGHASGQIGVEHFGLGDFNTARVRVLWPDGSIGNWQEFVANEMVELTQAD